MKAGISAAYQDTGQFDDEFFTRQARFFQTAYQDVTPSILDGYVPIDFFNLIDSTIMHEVSFPQSSLDRVRDAHVQSSATAHSHRKL